MKRPRLSVVLAALALGAAGAWALLRPAPLDEEAALAAYAELRLAQRELGDTTAAARSARDAILAKRGLDRARFAAWLEAWKKDPALWEERQNRLIATIDTLRQEFSPDRAQGRPAVRPEAGAADAKRGAPRPEAAAETARPPRPERARPEGPAVRGPRGGKR